MIALNTPNSLYVVIVDSYESDSYYANSEEFDLENCVVEYMYEEDEVWIEIEVAIYEYKPWLDVDNCVVRLLCWPSGFV